VTEFDIASVPKFNDLVPGQNVIVETSIPDFYVQLARGEEDDDDSECVYVYAKHEKTGWEWELFGVA
jgi:hypothetical protein